MAIKDILLFLRAGEAPGPAVSVAASLARRYAAHVRACCLVEEPEPELADCYAIGPAAVSEVLERLGRAAAAEVKSVRDAFLEAVGPRTLSEWSVSELNEDAGRSAERARLADLAIVGRSREGGGADRALAEAVALHSGAPCLIVPEAYAGPVNFDRIVLAWNGSAEARRAMDGGLTLLKTASLVEVVTVGELSPERQEHDAEAVVGHLGRHGVRAQARRLPHEADAAAALLHRCGVMDASLLIVGAYSHSRAAEAVLGGVTRRLLTHAPLPVLMSR